jgi:hypothetical protein
MVRAVSPATKVLLLAGDARRETVPEQACGIAVDQARCAGMLAA